MTCRCKDPSPHISNINKSLMSMLSAVIGTTFEFNEKVDDLKMPKII